MVHYSSEKLVFVETNPTFSQAIPFAKQLGFSPILFTRMNAFNPEYYQDAEIYPFDDIYDVNTHDANTMEKMIKEHRLDISGVISCYDDMVLPAALLAKKLALPHPAISGLKNTFFKDQVRTILKKCGIEQLDHCVIELNNIPAKPPLRYPIVIKPAHDAGADGVFLCRSLKQYQSILKKLIRNKFTFSGLERNKIVLEQYIEGDLYSAELLWQKSSWKMLGISKLFVDADNSFCLLGMSFPSDLTAALERKIAQEILTWVNCLELREGALSVEFKIFNNQPILIEINPRLAGSNVNELIRLGTGIAPIEYLIKQACGINYDLNKIKINKNKFYADAFIFPDCLGPISAINYTHISNDYLVSLDCKQLPLFINNTANGFDNIIGHALAWGKTCDQAWENAQEIAECVEIEP